MVAPRSGSLTLGYRVSYLDGEEGSQPVAQCLGCFEIHPQPQVGCQRRGFVASAAAGGYAFHGVRMIRVNQEMRSEAEVSDSATPASDRMRFSAFDQAIP